MEPIIGKHEVYKIQELDSSITVEQAKLNFIPSKLELSKSQLDRRLRK